MPINQLLVKANIRRVIGNLRLTILKVFADDLLPYSILKWNGLKEKILKKFSINYTINSFYRGAKECLHETSKFIDLRDFKRSPQYYQVVFKFCNR